MTAQQGKPSLYRPKDGDKTYRVAALTAKGQQLFEQARAKLKALTKWPYNVGDADVIEWLLRDKKPPK